MADTVTIRLAGPPMGKERVRVTRDGHAFTPQRTVTYEGRLAYAAQQAMAGLPLFDGPLAIVVEARMPIPVSWSKKKQADARSGKELPTKKPDWDNIGKILDAANLIVWADDAQIVDAVVRKRFSDKPELIITVTRKLPDAEDIFA
jgi:Holliday junction resolvase RusA-like endonuclease